MPGPGGSDNGRKVGIGWIELQDLVRGRGVCDQVSWIASSARLDQMGYLSPGLHFDCRQNVSHGVARAGTEVEGATRMSVEQQLQGFDMRGREIVDVNVVPDCGCSAIIARGMRWVSLARDSPIPPAGSAPLALK